jgi:hypothetical protein
MHNDIDRLPHGPDRKVHEIAIDDGVRPRLEYLFAHDVVDVVRDLIGDQKLKYYMHYAPERCWMLRD